MRQRADPRDLRRLRHASDDWHLSRLGRIWLAGGLVAVVHDELILEVLEDDAERARVILETAMTRAFVETFLGAPTKGVASASIGRSWA